MVEDVRKGKCKSKSVLKICLRIASVPFSPCHSHIFYLQKEIIQEHEERHIQKDIADKPKVTEAAPIHKEQLKELREDLKDIAALADNPVPGKNHKKQLKDLKEKLNDLANKQEELEVKEKLKEPVEALQPVQPVQQLKPATPAADINKIQKPALPDLDAMKQKAQESFLQDKLAAADKVINNPAVISNDTSAKLKDIHVGLAAAAAAPGDLPVYKAADSVPEVGNAGLGKGDAIDTKKEMKRR